jgi:hypothetical protein
MSTCAETTWRWCVGQENGCDRRRCVSGGVPSFRHTPPGKRWAMVAGMRSASVEGQLQRAADGGCAALVAVELTGRAGGVDAGPPEDLVDGRLPSPDQD